jgi:type IV secretory pathway protease TraF
MMTWPRLSRLFVALAVALFTLTVGGLAAGYRLNVTASLPLGLYRLYHLQMMPAYGDLVTFALPADLRLHWLLGTFTKPVAGLPGDVVCIQGSRLTINARDYGPVLDEAPIHQYADGTCRTVPPGHVFTASAIPRSYDSRYYGELPLPALLYTTPVFTWRD